MSSDPFDLVDTTIAGKYRVDELIGEGGFGLVYRGFHLGFEEPVAIKCLKVPTHFTTEARDLFLERFREEGKHLAKLRHDAVVRVFERAGRQGGQRTLRELERLQRCRRDPCCLKDDPRLTETINQVRQRESLRGNP